MKCLCIHKPQLTRKVPQLLYKNKGIVEFKTTIGNKLTLIKSMYAPIVTLSKTSSRFVTLDDEDTKFIVQWLIDNDMIHREDFDFKFTGE